MVVKAVEDPDTVDNEEPEKDDASLPVADETPVELEDKLSVELLLAHGLEDPVMLREPDKLDVRQREGEEDTLAKVETVVLIDAEAEDKAVLDKVALLVALELTEDEMLELSDAVTHALEVQVEDDVPLVHEESERLEDKLMLPIDDEDIEKKVLTV
jgi:hypothetical protein